ncbi:MAG: PQQ-dependent dehydrogenase, methanol/ethanol family [Cyclobacteriaceae bacterium]
MRLLKTIGYLLGCILVTTGCAQTPKDQSYGSIDENKLLSPDPSNWLTPGGGFREQYYSELNSINDENVQSLGFAWEYDASSKVGSIERGLEATPLVVDGIMYTSGAWGVVYALDAKTGAEIWRFDPPVDASYNRRACCDVVNRGVYVWKSKVYVGTLDGFLYCLDAQNGQVIWKVDTFNDRSSSYTITSAPIVAGDMVVIGNSGSDFGTRGYITAYDLYSGAEKWRFFTVPGDPKKWHEHPELEEAAKTWDPDSRWDAGGGGSVWGQMTYDPELNLLYVGTGNSSPYPQWFRSPSGGDNLYLCSILAINPDSGRLKWHYQTTPAEMWDFTSTMNIVLAELKIEGKQRKVLMQAPKNGFFYVIDRETGELLSAEKYTRVNWASHVDLETGKPVLTDQGNYRDEPKFVIPSMTGGHSWNPMSYSKLTNLVYIPEIIYPMIYSAVDDYSFTKLTVGTGLGAVWAPPFPPSMKKYLKGQTDTTRRSILKAWDPVKQEVKWQVENDVPGGNGGIMSTAGNLVFQCTNTGFLKVYNATTGEVLKEIEIGTAAMSAPSTCIIDGEQYVSVMAGFGGGLLAFSVTDPRAAYHKYKNYGRILTFKLKGGETPLPPLKKKVIFENKEAVLSMVVNEAQVTLGRNKFGHLCGHCHMIGESNDRYSHYPNLAYLTKAKQDIFESIVYDGAFASIGMASFKDVLSKNEVEAIRNYILSEQKRILTHISK